MRFSTMTQMENEPMLTDSPEERIEQLEKRVKRMELKGINWNVEQEIRGNINTLRHELSILISDVEVKFDNHIQSPPKDHIDNPLFFEDYIGVMETGLGDVRKLLQFLLDNWERVRLKK